MAVSDEGDRSSPSAGHGVVVDAGELLVRHRRGDRGAFAELVEEYRASVFSYLVRSGVRSADREDLFQEVFLRLHRAADSYDPERRFHSWIFTIVANAVRNYQRKRRVRQLVFAEPAPVDDPPDREADGERRASARETVAWLEVEIQRLRPAQRQVLLLVTVEHLRLKEVAAALELPLNTVKTHLRRARLTLVAALERRKVRRSGDEGSAR